MLKTEFPRRLEYTLQYFKYWRTVYSLLFYSNTWRPTDLDPRLPITIASISNDVTIPPGINGATLKVSLKSLVIRALGLPRSLALFHNYEKPTLILWLFTQTPSYSLLAYLSWYLGTVKCLSFFLNSSSLILYIR